VKDQVWVSSEGSPIKIQGLREINVKNDNPCTSSNPPDGVDTISKGVSAAPVLASSMSGDRQLSP
jgi:hypothetical protein